MSSTEHWEGTLTRIKFEYNLPFGEMVKVLEKEYDMEGFNTDKDIWCNDDLVYYYDEFYSIDKIECDPGSDIIRASRDTRDIIQFETKFYNGGTCFSECLIEALKDVD